MYIQDLLGMRPNSEALSNFISALSVLVDATDAAQPEIKSYPNSVYFNYNALGLSLLFVPQHGYKPTPGLKRSELQENKLLLDGIDIYNIPENNSATKTSSTSARTAEVAFSSYPALLVVLHPVLVAEEEGAQSEHFEFNAGMTGKDFVQLLGEPERKGGGQGPSSGSIGIWCEWTKRGMMVEFGGAEARGPQAWERGKDAVWRVITLFPAAASATTDDSQ